MTIKKAFFYSCVVLTKNGDYQGQLHGIYYREFKSLSEYEDEICSRRLLMNFIDGVKELNNIDKNHNISIKSFTPLL